MAQVTASVQINTGPEPIWALLSDPHRYPDFVDPTERMVNVCSGEFGVGYTYKEYSGIKPFLGDIEWRVTEFEPMKRQVHIGDDGKMWMPLEIDLTPNDSGTQLTIKIAMKPRWFLAPFNAVLWPLIIRKRAQAELDKTVAEAKRIAESSG
jgi:hypothetical protein